MKITSVFFLLLSVTALTGCEKNPLLGTWKVKSGQSGFLPEMCSEIVFTKDSSRCGSILEDVSYDIQGNLVIVSSELGDKLGTKVAYEIIDNNTIVIDILGKRVIYSRYGY
jgi:hypothetical protein